jgi:hypothetical protein
VGEGTAITGRCPRFKGICRLPDPRRPLAALMGWNDVFLVGTAESRCNALLWARRLSLGGFFICPLSLLDFAALELLHPSYRRLARLKLLRR